MGIRAFLPEGARVRRDRGKGLYVAEMRVENACFTSERIGDLWRVYPTEKLVRRFEGREPSSPLERSTARFRELPVDRETLALFCAAAKLLEAPEPSRAGALDREIRKRAALSMRAGGGGGLYACAAILNNMEVDET